MLGNVQKSLEIQKQARDNVNVFQSYLTDLQNWETEMKRKEAASNSQFEQDLPPIRSKLRKEKPVAAVNKSTSKKILGSDYQAWEKFDVDQALEEIDMTDIGPASLDSKKSEIEKKEKFIEEAQVLKEKGNAYVKQNKWDEAVSCYSRAIELVNDDAIYYANRALCYLKMENYHQAESDCSQALQLDCTYVKALQRRATAREHLSALRSASKDLEEVLKLEPQNVAAKKQLAAIKSRMGTKRANNIKSSTASPETESKPAPGSKPVTSEKVEVKEAVDPTSLQNWLNGAGENLGIIKPLMTKPPHLRSKKPLKSILIKEIPLGHKSPSKLTGIDGVKVNNDSNETTVGNNLNNTMITDNDETKPSSSESPTSDKDVSPTSQTAESAKLINDTLCKEIDVKIEDLVPPVNSHHFMTMWKSFSEKGDARSKYLSIIEPCKIPSIFDIDLQSSVLSDILRILESNPKHFEKKTVTAYVDALSRVKRFSILAMFLSQEDKKVVEKILDYCKTVENCSDEMLEDLKKRYEI